MPIQAGYTDPNASGDFAILPPREHACKLLSVTLTTGKAYQSDEEIEQLKFSFESLQWKDDAGRPGGITLWTGTNYGSARAKLTTFLDSVFGRALSEAESRRLDLEKLAGLKGYVTVLPHTKADGTKTSKFGGFRHPDNATPPKPEDYYLDTEEAKHHVVTEAPKRAPKPKAALPEDEDNVPDPFAK